jgi:hypothetical protein
MPFMYLDRSSAKHRQRGMYLAPDALQALSSPGRTPQVQPYSWLAPSCCCCCCCHCQSTSCSCCCLCCCQCNHCPCCCCCCCQSIHQPCYCCCCCRTLLLPLSVHPRLLCSAASSLCRTHPMCSKAAIAPAAAAAATAALLCCLIPLLYSPQVLKGRLHCLLAHLPRVVSGLSQQYCILLGVNVQPIPEAAAAIRAAAAHGTERWAQPAALQSP